MFLDATDICRVRFKRKYHSFRAYELTTKHAHNPYMSANVIEDGTGFQMRKQRFLDRRLVSSFCVDHLKAWVQPSPELLVRSKGDAEPYSCLLWNHSAD